MRRVLLFSLLLMLASFAIWAGLADSSALPRPPASPPVTVPLAPAEAPTAATAIRIRHELVEAAAPVRRHIPARVRSKAAERAPHGAALSRTRRALFGTGKYRPQPFPRAAQ